MNDPALTPPAIAKLLGVDVHRVLAWIRKGELLASNVGDGAKRPRWRVMPGDLADFLRRRRATPAAKAARPRKKEQTWTSYFN